MAEFAKKPKIYNPKTGENLENATDNAKAMAGNGTVKFIINEIPYFVTSESTLQNVLDQQNEYIEVITEKQKNIVEALIKKSSNFIDKGDEIALQYFAKISENHYFTSDEITNKVLKLFEKFGYSANKSLTIEGLDNSKLSYAKEAIETGFYGLKNGGDLGYDNYYNLKYFAAEHSKKFPSTQADQAIRDLNRVVRSVVHEGRED